MEAAFFDLDKTIIARPSLAAYGPVLRKAGYLSATTTLRSIWGQLLFRFSGTSESSMERIRKTALKLAAGWEQEGLRRLANEHLTNVIEPIVFDEALEVLNLHREAGRLLVLVSASPAEIVEPLANHLGVDEYVATTATIDVDGRYTGDVELYVHGSVKAEAIENLAEKRNLDLSKSWAYSDSVSDIPMLESVGFPVAVNPDRNLRREAELREWPILEFDNPIALGDRIHIERNQVIILILSISAFIGLGLLIRKMFGRDKN